MTKQLCTVMVLPAYCRPHGDYTNANILWRCQLLRQSRRHNRLRRGHCPRNQIILPSVDLYKRRKRTHGRHCQTCPPPMSLHVVQAIIRTYSSLRVVDHSSINLKLGLWLRLTLCLIELSRALISLLEHPCFTRAESIYLGKVATFNMFISSLEKSVSVVYVTAYNLTGNVAKVVFTNKFKGLILLAVIIYLF